MLNGKLIPQKKKSLSLSVNIFFNFLTSCNMKIIFQLFLQKKSP
ncbi:hypothetical Protein YC6258_04312 [Gynuella sunshinyii YC6258]|uniref:Uncharacterized protein n=1 Tax=Gynuella sunshinyii YC6258 TaxID=1445510 RepID=A0A0C5VQ26_9GAMM|nr:hypothetical Protein YC6258_04312 [Gynuella sunshinyii YC6258]